MKYLGLNAKIYPTAKILFQENFSLGDESIIADFCFIYANGQGIEIGNFCNITQHCIVQAGGLVKIHNFVGLGPRTTILAASDDYKGGGLIGLGIFGQEYRNVSFNPVTLHKHAQIGMGSIIMPGVTIGEGCSIGAGSLVTKDMPEWSICYGSPCKPIKSKPSKYQLELEQKFLDKYYG